MLTDKNIRTINICDVRDSNGNLLLDAKPLPEVDTLIKVLLVDNAAKKLDLNPLKWIEGKVQQIGHQFKFFSESEYIVTDVNNIRSYIYKEINEKHETN